MNSTQNQVIKITDLKKGTKIVTGGGNTGRITGHRDRESVQIRLESGEYDWISKLAQVQRVED